MDREWKEDPDECWGPGAQGLTRFAWLLALYAWYELKADAR